MAGLLFYRPTTIEPIFVFYFGLFLVGGCWQLLINIYVRPYTSDVFLSDNYMSDLTHLMNPCPIIIYVRSDTWWIPVRLSFMSDLTHLMNPCQIIIYIGSDTSDESLLDYHICRTYYIWQILVRLPYMSYLTHLINPCIYVRPDTWWILVRLPYMSDYTMYTAWIFTNLDCMMFGKCFVTYISLSPFKACCHSNLADAPTDMLLWQPE